MKCWSCHSIIIDLPVKIPFRATCDHCHAALHCCQNCTYYQPGQPNDCLVPNTEFVSDRTAPNFCEEFKLKIPKESDKHSEKKDKTAAFNRLFQSE